MNKYLVPALVALFGSIFGTTLFRKGYKRICKNSDFIIMGSEDQSMQAMIKTEGVKFAKLTIVQILGGLIGGFLGWKTGFLLQGTS